MRYLETNGQSLVPVNEHGISHKLFSDTNIEQYFVAIDLNSIILVPKEDLGNQRPGNPLLIA